MEVTVNQGIPRPNFEYKNYTNEIVSTVAYLIGVRQNIFDNEYCSLRNDIFDKLEENKHAKIVRHLSIIRTAAFVNYNEIHSAMTYDMKNLNSVPQYISQEDITALEINGINILKPNYRLSLYLQDMSRIISSEIIHCRSLFPSWLNWDYIRDIFTIPTKKGESDVKNECNKFVHNRSYYPYQMYIKWTASEDDGNILYNDKRFCAALYEKHGTQFLDEARLKDATPKTKNDIYEFINSSEGTVIIVDCENSNPLKMYATLKNLDEKHLQKINKILLFNDAGTADAWTALKSNIKIPVEETLVDRVLNTKSLVDMQVAMGTSREHYENGINNFILVSSDSDYWTMIKSLNGAKFFVMVESDKCSSEMKDKLSSEGISFCYLDDFYGGNIDNYINETLKITLQRLLDSSININIDALLNEAYIGNHMTATPAERNNFYMQYIKKMQLIIDNDGNLKIVL